MKFVNCCYHYHITYNEIESGKYKLPLTRSWFEIQPDVLQAYMKASFPGGELPYEEYMGVCHELGSYFQEKIPKRVCQFFTKIPERAIISVRNSR